MPVLGETDGRNRGGSTFLSDTIPTMTGAASSADREEAGDQSLGDRKKTKLQSNDRESKFSRNGRSGFGSWGHRL